MIRKNRLKTFILSVALSLLISTSLSLYYPQLGIEMREVEANPPVSDKWLYSGWQNRKEHNITRNQIDDARFYDTSDPWTTISGNPTDRHTFQPVHNTTIVEVNKIVDGASRKYLAYDSDTGGTQIRLYYTDDIGGTWAPYSGNPILSGADSPCRWPSVAYVDGVFHMFLDDWTDNVCERWISTDGINFTFVENIIVGGVESKNPFVWLNPNDNKWYLYFRDAVDLPPWTEYIKVRVADNIEDLDLANNTTVLSQPIPFGSPTVIYHENEYWLLAEILQGEVWKVVAYYSTTSPSLGFNECFNSPILSDDEACPILLLTPDQAKAYLFITRNSSKWYQDTREVYLSKTTSETPNLVEYQIRITAYYENGTDNGDKVYLNGHSRTDFGDVRFTWFNSSSGDEVECDYWIEELKTNESAVFWVKIPEISSTINNTIYIYYGKSDATTTSNGEATFDFFDDFNGALTKWTLVGGTWQIENGALSAQTATYGQRIRANNFLFQNNSVHVKVKWITGTYFENGPYVRGQWPNEQYFGYMTFLSTWNGDQSHRISKITGGPYGTTIMSQGTTNPSKDIWYNIVFKLYGNRLKSSISPLYYTEISGTDSSLNNGSLCLFSWSASNEHVHFDDLFVSKYVEPEPTHADWGSEEIAEPPVASFTYSPANPKLSEPILFNASLSTPNGGTITNYEWNFGDGNITSTSSPTIIHAYTTPGTYNVTLTISDSEGLNASTWKGITFTEYRDISITSVTPSAATVLAGTTVNINVTVKNEGSITETFNVTTYYDNSEIATQTVTDLTPEATLILTFNWNTSTIPLGNYTIKATATTVPGETDTADNIHINGIIRIVNPPTANFTYSPANPKLSESILFNASLSTPNGGTIIDYKWSFGDGNTTSTPNPTIIHAYTTPATYNVTLTISDSEGLNASTWRSITITTYIETKISISTYPSSSFIGNEVNINGTLTDLEENGIPGATIVISYMFPGTSEWTLLTSASTDYQGVYYATWVPQSTGEFTLKAEWTGNETYLGTNKNTTLTIIPYEDKSIFSVASNSTISALTFNSTSLELSFTVSGPTGTTGYTNVIIAKTLVANVTDLKVYLDGSPLEYSTNSTTDSWIIEFTYSHSTHRIVIALNSITETTPTANPTTPMLLALLIATLILATVIKKKKPHTHITHQKHANSQGPN